jgi:hypothetical protein
MYVITDYTKRKAHELGVEVRQSKNPKKKIDVYKNGKKVGSIGQAGAKDYPTYLKEEGKEVADERRRLYHLRHPKNTLGEALAKYLLW